MATQFVPSSYRSHRIEQFQANLSDCLVRPVLPRAIERNSKTSATIPWAVQHTSHLNVSDAGEKTGWLTETSPGILHGEVTTPQASTPLKRTSSRSSSNEDEPVLNGGVLELRKKITIAERRRRGRTNQARYRARQERLILKFEESLRQLRQELDDLKQRRSKFLFKQRALLSPWVVVAEVFRIVEDSIRSPQQLERENMDNDLATRQDLEFLHKFFVSDVILDEHCGIDSLIEQWRSHALCFTNSRLQLRRVEAVAPNIILATGRLCLTITELTLRRLFPVLGSKPQDSLHHQNLHDRLLGQQVTCSVSVAFFFDEQSGCVARLEPKVDLLTALLGISGNLKDVSECYTSA